MLACRHHRKKETPALKTGTLIGILFRDRQSPFYAGYSVKNNDSDEILHVIEKWDSEELVYWRNKYKDIPNFRFHLHADNLELVYPAVHDKLRSLGVDLHKTAPYHSSSNGLAERGIGVIDQKERTLRIARNMPDCFREDAWNFAIHLTNIFPYRYKGEWHLDPHTQYKGRTIDYSKLRVPFSTCFVYNRHRVKGQDVRKGRKGIFCGYVPDSNAYKVWVLSISDYVTTGDVTWDEKQLKPLIEQATILESGGNPQISNPNQSSISSQGEVGSEQPALDTLAHGKDLRELKEGGAVQYSELDTLEDDPTEWDTWMEVAMSRIGHFIISEKRVI